MNNIPCTLSPEYGVLAQGLTIQKAHAFVGTRAEDRGWPRVDVREISRAAPEVFGLVDDSGKAISFSEWATLAQDRAGWLKLVTKVPFDIGKPQLRPPRCDTTQGPRQRRSGGLWLGAPKRQSNDGLSSMQKQTLKRYKSGSKFIHEQFPL